MAGYTEARATEQVFDSRGLPKAMVLRARLELARLSALDPKSSAAANYATSASKSYASTDGNP
jgi:hypothetical protein